MVMRLHAVWLIINSEELALIQGQASGQFEKILGYSDNEEVIHRDNLVLV